MSRQPDDHSWEEEAMFLMNKEIEELKVDLNIVNDLRCDERKGCRIWNGVLTCVIIVLVVVLATRLCPW